ncbi:hypothetical protein [Actinacidiphila rubida]|uniref:Secreted protein n=1 Tax=Actinacidiphila rubida TaxID=310780 RepID=A0A1H8FAI8_9ACTN|nr:hypothetical protein [Actinacidiphila rubida]SEN28596.1 hypothetical protein SAMN05216267_1003211 [Actinacidiphila rubida]
MGLSMRTAAVGAFALFTVTAVTAGSATAAPQDTVRPEAVPGSVIAGGADGTPRTLTCPPQENATGGGFTLSAAPGSRLSTTPADVLENRPTADATGWTIAVRKDLTTQQAGRTAAADLTLYVVCARGASTVHG